MVNCFPLGWILISRRDLLILIITGMAYFVGIFVVSNKQRLLMGTGHNKFVGRRLTLSGVWGLSKTPPIS